MHTQQIPPVVIASQIFDHEIRQIPENQKDAVCEIVREKLKEMRASNDTVYVSVVRAYETIKDQIDDQTTQCFLRFLKGAVNADPRRKEELAERGYDMEKISALDPLSPETPSNSSRRKPSFKINKRNSIPDFTLE